MFSADLLAGKHILVTGGGTGLGAAMARRFAQLGATLLLTGRREAVLQGTAQSIAEECGTPVAIACCDVRDPTAVADTIDRAWQRLPIDVLVNNAAATFIARTEGLSARAADAVLAPTLHGALYNTLELGRRWIEHGRRGVVLSILSTSTITGRAFTVPSAMAKSAVLAMTRSLAVEWGPRGIRTVAIAPGPFPTAGASAQLNPQERAQATRPESRNPLGRVGEHSELANLAAYLVSDHAGYINGEMVTIDGGQHLRTSGAEDLLQWRDEDWQRLRNRVGRSGG